MLLRYLIRWNMFKLWTITFARKFSIRFNPRHVNGEWKKKRMKSNEVARKDHHTIHVFPKHLNRDLCESWFLWLIFKIKSITFFTEQESSLQFSVFSSRRSKRRINDLRRGSSRISVLNLSLVLYTKHRRDRKIGTFLYIWFRCLEMEKKVSHFSLKITLT